jgi:aspartate racemase
MSFKTIGILGGMGPEATSELYMEVVKIFQKEFGAKFDKDFPPFFIYSLPIPDVVEGMEDKDRLISMLVEGVNKLEQAGVDFVAIACNSVQVFLSEIRMKTSTSIISIPEETMKVIKQQGYTKVGLLATNTTLNSGIYQQEAVLSNIKLIQPKIELQKELTGIIMKILSGVKEDSLNGLISSLKSEGAQAVILGCTDLPLLISGDGGIDLFGTTKILARAIVGRVK